nr:5-formyltetrahydrofolate cyclo-ligase [Acetatifactor sp.]
MDKKAIRKEALQRRDNLSNAEKQKASVILTERILGHQWYYQSDVILCFASYGNEISTEDILQDALQNGKKLFLPKVVGKSIIFYRISNLSELESGYKGILEPSDKAECYEMSEYDVNKTLLLMPGVAYDRYRHRIGYGGGFYDRFLHDNPELQFRSIAVGFR